jgi:ketosteroid isomerase-like protein
VKKLLVIWLLILLAFGFSCKKKAEEGNPYATPESTIKEYAKAMKEGDFERAIKCYSQDALVDMNPLQGKLTPAEMKQLFLSSLKASQGAFKTGDITIVEVKMTAKIKFKVGDEDRELQMIKEPEGWKIATHL